jgi:hypothetical protein
MLAVFVMAAVPVLAQRPGGGRGMGGGRGPLGLLMRKDVQEDLKMSEDQVSKVKELSDKQREAMAEMKDLSKEERQDKMKEMGKANQKALVQILKPEQQKRLKQLQLQQEGPNAIVRNPEVADGLNLNGDQREKLKGIADDTRKEMQDLRDSGETGPEMFKKMAEINKNSGEKIMAVLTDEQKTKWKEMQGEPFKGDLRGGGRRGPAPEKKGG